MKASYNIDDWSEIECILSNNMILALTLNSL